MISKEDIRQLCLDAGACAVGFAAASEVPASQQKIYECWLAEGRNAGMEYMARYADVRRNPSLLIENNACAGESGAEGNDSCARTLIVCAFAYADGSTPRHALIADYALSDDYHNVLRRRLQPVAAALEAAVQGSATRICVDTAPLRERFWASRAGVGYIGLNNQLIVPGIGSAVVLGTLLWTEVVTPDASLEHRTCRRCGRCVATCPGGALTADGAMDCRRCLSYLTIEHRGALPVGTRLPGRIYGCDICRHVCPEGNPDTAANPEGKAAKNIVCEEFAPRAAVMALDAEAIAAMTPADFSSIFGGSAVKRAKLEGLQRNLRAAVPGGLPTS